MKKVLKIIGIVILSLVLIWCLYVTNETILYDNYIIHN